MLEAIADYEIAQSLDSGLRLRTACDLTVKALVQGERPNSEDAARRIAKHAADCSDDLGQVTEVVWSKQGKGN